MRTEGPGKMCVQTAGGDPTDPRWGNEWCGDRRLRMESFSPTEQTHGDWVSVTTSRRLREELSKRPNEDLLLQFCKLQILS